ncbi:MAG: TIM barrel protein [Rhodothermales bacterium]|nr:TIM barrel protein [Rhodothermales bacterium]
MNRRTFLAQTTALAALAPLMPVSTHSIKPSFSISLAEWSLHRTLFSGALQPLDFPVVARRTYGIDAVEYVNQFFLVSELFVAELKRRADGEGVKNLLIMVDDAGRLGDANPALRQDAINRHRPWLDIAAALGCHSIRINARSEGSAEEQTKLMADGLQRLGDEAATRGLNVIVENHGGFSSQGAWVANLMRTLNHANVGTLPDFGNWYPADEYGGPTPAGKAGPYYDRYQGVDETMPFARGLSAKSYAFDAQGNETSTDFGRMMAIAVKHGFSGHVGIEYEGSAHSEHDGILATKQLLEGVRASMG